MGQLSIIRGILISPQVTKQSDKKWVALILPQCFGYAQTFSNIKNFNYTWIKNTTQLKFAQFLALMLLISWSTFANDRFPKDIQPKIIASTKANASVIKPLNQTLTNYADLSLSKTASATQVTTGEQISYIIRVKNAGPSIATNVEVTDVIPGGMDYVTASNGATISNGTVTAHFDTIAVGATAEFRIYTKITATDGSIGNMAQVSKSDQSDPNSTPGNALSVHEDDDSTAVVILTSSCNPQTPIISSIKTAICLGDSSLLAALGCNGTVVWSNNKTGASIYVTPIQTTTYTAICTAGTCQSPKSNQLTIVVTTGVSPVISSNATTVCGGNSVTLTATGCTTGTLTWSSGQTGNTLTVLPTVSTSYYANCVGSSCQTGQSNAIAITVVSSNAAPTVTASNNTVCNGSSTTLTANGCSGTVLWSNSMSGSTISVAPTATTSYTAQCKIGNCTSSNSSPLTINVASSQIPVVTTSSPSICGSGSVTLTATNCSGVTTWSTGTTGTTLTVSPTVTTNYSATCATNTSCGNLQSNIITITVGQMPTVPTITYDKSSICIGGSITLTANGCSGLANWSSGDTTQVIVIHPIKTTTYVVKCQVGSCVSANSVAVTINVNSPTAPVITSDVTQICNGVSANLSASTGCTGNVIWYSNQTTASVGTGMYLTVNPLVTTAYTAVCNTGTCQSESSNSITINVNGSNLSKPSVTVSPSSSVCYGDSVILTASGTGTAFKWSNGATTKTIAVKQSGVYTVMSSNGGGCTSPNSDSTVVFVGSLIPAPSVSSTLKNICPATTANLATAVTSSLSNTSDTFEYHVANSPTSDLVSNSNAIGTGTYYVYEKSPKGCYSASSPIAVTIENCVVYADVAINKVASRSNVLVGDTVTYTITVKNNGPSTATNIVISDKLPIGLKFGSTGSGLTFAGDSLATSIASLAANESKTYQYIAKLTKTDVVKNIANILKVDQIDTLKTNNSSEADISCKTCTNACLGLALSADTAKQADGSYYVTYKSIVDNCGSILLKNVQIVDTLSKAFPSPVTFQVKSTSLSAGSSLVLNSAFNGNSDPRIIIGDSTSTLKSLQIDTVTVVVKVILSGQKGPFKTNAYVLATTAEGGQIRDTSNNGTDPTPLGSTPTSVNFTILPNTLIGIAKSAGTVTKVTTNVYDVTYTFNVKNYGKNDFSKVQVIDDLKSVFGDSVKIDSVHVISDAGLTVNSSYTGSGQNINLLVDSTSSLAVNASKAIQLFVRVDLSKSPIKTFSNSALAKGTTATGTATSDLSAAGTNPDPDGDGNPTNNSIPTQVIFDTTGVTTNVTTLGIAKAAIVDLGANVDGTFNVTYSVVIKNYSTNPLSNIQVSDSLSHIFTSDSSDFAIYPNSLKILNSGSKLTIDSTFDGRNNFNLLVANNSSLAVGATDTLQFKLKVLNSYKVEKTFKNTINGSALDGTKVVTDISQSGYNPDNDGDGNPGNNNEPTIIKIKSLYITPDSLVVIPQGFSPNGDGVNDTFEIIGLEGRSNVEVQIFNRYGNLIYEDLDYGRDGYKGWDGRATHGFLANSSKVVPSGTYYYWIKAPDYNGGVPVRRYITIVN